MDNCKYIVVYYSKTEKIYTYRFYYLKNARKFVKGCKNLKDCDFIQLTKIIK